MPNIYKEGEFDQASTTKDFLVVRQEMEKFRRKRNTGVKHD